MDYEIIDVERWHRKEQFDFFRTFDEPFTGVVVDVNVSNTYKLHKQNGLSFFQIYLFKCLKAAIATKALRLRIVDGQLRDYRHIHASAVIMRSDRSFGFSHVGYNDDFKVFSSNFEAEKLRVAGDRSLFSPKNLPNEIHFSAMPWLQFTSVTHARKFNSGDTCPKISFGKTYSKAEQLMMPVSIHVHHALADGIDMGEFFENYQKELDKDTI